MLHAVFARYVFSLAHFSAAVIPRTGARATAAHLAMSKGAIVGWPVRPKSIEQAVHRLGIHGDGRSGRSVEEPVGWFPAPAGRLRCLLKTVNSG